MALQNSRILASLCTCLMQLMPRPEDLHTGVSIGIPQNIDFPSYRLLRFPVAPEVIEENGLTTASDIWSVGCTTIELITGKPPYAELAQYPAMFRILQDDHPPIPETFSHALRDFLMQTFQKDPNLRTTATQLLRHPWLKQGIKKSSATVENGGRSSPERGTSYSGAVFERRPEPSPAILRTPPGYPQVTDDDDWDSMIDAESPSSVVSGRSFAPARSAPALDAWQARPQVRDINRYAEPEMEEFTDLATEGKTRH